MLQRTIGLSWDPWGTVQTMRAIALIEQAVQLADHQFPGDPLAEVCRFASREARQAVLCIVRSRPALFDRPPTPQNVMAALRKMVRSKAGPATLPGGVGDLIPTDLGRVLQLKRCRSSRKAAAA